MRVGVRRIMFVFIYISIGDLPFLSIWLVLKILIPGIII